MMGANTERFNTCFPLVRGLCDACLFVVSEGKRSLETRGLTIYLLKNSALLFQNRFLP